MSQREMRNILSTGSELQYVDPTKFKDKLRITLTRAEKLAGDIRVTNVRQEFISNRVVVVPQETPDVENSRTEAISVRVIISGSVESKIAVRQVVKDTFAAVNSALEDQTDGFIANGKTYFINVE